MPSVLGISRHYDQACVAKRACPGQIAAEVGCLERSNRVIRVLLARLHTCTQNESIKPEKIPPLSEGCRFAIMHSLQPAGA